MTNRAILPSIKFHRSSTSVTLTDGVAGQLTEIIAIKIQKGLGVFLPGRFPLLFKVSGAVHQNSEIYWGYRTPHEPRRTTGIGNTILYTVFKDLTISEQRHGDYRAVTVVELGIHPGLALIEDETFVVSLWTPSGVALAADTQFELPYYERKPGDLVAEIALRQAHFGL